MLHTLRLKFDPDRSSRAWAGADQRASERWRCVLDIELELDHESHFFTGLSQDISEGGLFVATYRVVPIGIPLGLRLCLIDGGQLEARGEVRWVRETRTGDGTPGVGIAFTELFGSARERIAELCEQRPPFFFES